MLFAVSEVCVWVAMWGAFQVVQLTPRGVLDPIPSCFLGQNCGQLETTSPLNPVLFSCFTFLYSPTCLVSAFGL